MRAVPVPGSRFNVQGLTWNFEREKGDAPFAIKMCASPFSKAHNADLQTGI
jgi:hypothetical protein